MQKVRDFSYDGTQIVPVRNLLLSDDDERHWELAFEGLRYYDLLRWGIAAEVLSQQNGVKVLDNMVETRMDMGDIAQRLQATKGLMPLPKTQIDLSAGILEQNPGWGNESNMN